MTQEEASRRVANVAAEMLRRKAAADPADPIFGTEAQQRAQQRSSSRYEHLRSGERMTPLSYAEWMAGEPFSDAEIERMWTQSQLSEMAAADPSTRSPTPPSSET